MILQSSSRSSKPLPVPRDGDTTEDAEAGRHALATFLSDCGLQLWAKLQRPRHPRTRTREKDREGWSERPAGAMQHGDDT